MRIKSRARTFARCYKMKIEILKKLHKISKNKKLQEMMIMNQINQSIKSEEEIIEKISKMREKGHKDFMSNTHSFEHYIAFAKTLDANNQRRIQILQSLRMRKIKQHDILLKAHKEEKKYENATEKTMQKERFEQNLKEQKSSDELSILKFKNSNN